MAYSIKIIGYMCDPKFNFSLISFNVLKSETSISTKFNKEIPHFSMPTIAVLYKDSRKMGSHYDANREDSKNLSSIGKLSLFL